MVAEIFFLINRPQSYRHVWCTKILHRTTIVDFDVKIVNITLKDSQYIVSSQD